MASKKKKNKSDTFPSRKVKREEEDMDNFTFPCPYCGENVEDCICYWNELYSRPQN